MVDSLSPIPNPLDATDPFATLPNYFTALSVYIVPQRDFRMILTACTLLYCILHGLAKKLLVSGRSPIAWVLLVVLDTCLAWISWQLCPASPKELIYLAALPIVLAYGCADVFDFAWEMVQKPKAKPSFALDPEIFEQHQKNSHGEKYLDPLRPTTAEPARSLEETQAEKKALVDHILHTTGHKDLRNCIPKNRRAGIPSDPQKCSIEYLAIVSMCAILTQLRLLKREGILDTIVRVSAVPRQPGLVGPHRGEVQLYYAPLWHIRLRAELKEGMDEITQRRIERDANT